MMVPLREVGEYSKDTGRIPWMTKSGFSVYARMSYQCIVCTVAKGACASRRASLNRSITRWTGPLSLFMLYTDIGP